MGLVGAGVKAKAERKQTIEEKEDDCWNYVLPV